MPCQETGTVHDISPPQLKGYAFPYNIPRLLTRIRLSLLVFRTGQELIILLSEYYSEGPTGGFKHPELKTRCFNP